MKWVVWICIAGIVFSLAGLVGFFVMPLLWIAWAKWSASQSASVEALVRDEERRLDQMIARGRDTAAPSNEALPDVVALFESLRPLIRTDLATYRQAMAGLEQGRIPMKIGRDGKPDGVLVPKDWKAFLARNG